MTPRDEDRVRHWGRTAQKNETDSQPGRRPRSMMPRLEGPGRPGTDTTGPMQPSGKPPDVEGTSRKVALVTPYPTTSQEIVQGWHPK